jgi:predicted GNAT superfamily acetyltransferase
MEQNAGFEIRPLSGAGELAACVHLQRTIWGAEFSDVVPPSLLTVVPRVGGVAAGAFGADDELLGFVFGIPGVVNGTIIHWSDMLGVHPRARNRGVGRRLKDFQRQHARAAGATALLWSMDPLVARNAHFNINRLGARVVDYIPDLYGATDTPLHGGIATDRLIVALPTAELEIERNVAESERANASADCARGPVVTAAWIDEVREAAILPHCVRVEIPSDGEQLLASRHPEAARWRGELRRAFEWARNCGYSVVAVHGNSRQQRSFYLLTRAGTPRPVQRV